MYPDDILTVLSPSFSTGVYERDSDFRPRNQPDSRHCIPGKDWVSLHRSKAPSHVKIPIPNNGRNGFELNKNTENIYLVLEKS